jgi:uncharacterized delta-60 repeat protein
MAMMRRTFLFVFLVACGNVQEQPTDGGGDDGGGSTGAFTLTISNPNASVPLDGQNRILLQVSRVDGFAGDIAIAPMSPPAGVTITSTTIPAGSTTGEVVISGAAPLTIGATVSITLEGTNPAVAPHTVNLPNAPVTGRPGALDPMFGPGTGVATISLGADDDGAFQQLDVINGSVLGVGWSTGGLGTQRFISMKFTSAGAIDATWNAGGLLRSSFGVGGSGEASHAFATGQQTDGRSILIGEQENGAGDIGLLRLSTTGGAGGVDFGDGTGKSIVNLGASETVADGVVLASNQIIAVGSRNAQLFIARMTTGGLLDTTFNSPTGYATATLGTSSQSTNVVVDSTDRLLVAGSFNAGTESDVFIRRYAASGALDGAFGGNNGVIISGVDSETAIGLTTLGDKILVASNAGTTLGTRIRVRRYGSDGALDTTFGTQGVAEYAPIAAGISAVDMTALPDGRIVVLANAAGTALLIRFTAGGAIDSLFGTSADGTASINIGDSGLPVCLSVYSDHQIVVGGGNQGGMPGPGTFAVIARMWM